MIKLMDRQLILGYLKAYGVCLLSLLSLYIVVDLFTNLDDFTHGHSSFAQVLAHIISYYGYKTPQIFDRLCEAILLLAAMFTVTLMQRNNEQMPLLSAGVSTHRIVRPVLVCACLMLTLTVLNQELLIPKIADKLTLDKDDPDGLKNLGVRGNFEPNGIHIEGKFAWRHGLKIAPFNVVIPESLGGQLLLEAKEAHYIPARKGWAMVGTIVSGTKPGDFKIGDNDPLKEVLEVSDDAGSNDDKNKGCRCFLHTREVDFDALTRSNNWFLLASTYRLYRELQKPETPRLAAMAVLFHIRITRPLLGMLLVFLGLSMVLRDTTRNVILSAGACLVLCGIFFVVTYTCKMLGENDVLTPPLAAWMPVLIFGPFVFVLFDAVQT